LDNLPQIKEKDEDSTNYNSFKYNCSCASQLTNLFVKVAGVSTNTNLIKIITKREQEESNNYNPWDSTCKFIA